MQKGLFKEVKSVATAASSLERTRIEKAAVDAGFDLTPELSDGWLVFRSSLFPVQVAVQTRQDSYDLGVSTENVGSRLYAELGVPMAVHQGHQSSPGRTRQAAYFDPRLSKSGFISCNSCHNLSTGGTDNIPTSIGDKWQQGPINAPTVLNSTLNVAQFWDGRAADLKAQAGGPIANPGEMGFSHTLAVGMLQTIPGYVTQFKKAFGSDQIDIDKVTKAIAAFEDTLVTPNSRFDKWLKGEKKALTANELAGYQLFKETGCGACHNGPAVGGNSFQKFGVVEPYKGDSKAYAVGYRSLTAAK